MLKKLVLGTIVLYVTLVGATIALSVLQMVPTWIPTSVYEWWMWGAVTFGAIACLWWAAWENLRTTLFGLVGGALAFFSYCYLFRRNEMILLLSDMERTILVYSGLAVSVVAAAAIGLFLSRRPKPAPHK